MLCQAIAISHFPGHFPFTFLAEKSPIWRRPSGFVVQRAQNQNPIQIPPEIIVSLEVPLVEQGFLQSFEALCFFYLIAAAN